MALLGTCIKVISDYLSPIYIMQHHVTAVVSEFRFVTDCVAPVTSCY